MAQIKDLKANPKNPRKITAKELDGIRKSIEKHGDLSGIVYNRQTKLLVGGHQRTSIIPPEAKIVIETKYEQPTRAYTVAEGYVVIDGERFKYREVDAPKDWETSAMLAANKHQGEWDEIKLKNLLKTETFDFEAAGFDLEEIADFHLEDYTPDLVIDEQQLNPVTDTQQESDAQYVKDTPQTTEEIPTERPEAQVKREEAIPEPPVKIVVLPGQVFQLGRHRLMCGDSTKDLESLLSGQAIDLIFTDPPYDQDQVETEFSKTRPGWADHMADNLNQFDPACIKDILAKSGAKSGYFFCNKKLLQRYIEWAQEFNTWDLLVMGKKNPVPLKGQKYLSDIEYIVFVREKGAYFNDKLEYDWYRKVRMVSCKAREFGHPTEKQVAMCEPFLQVSAPQDGAVLDCFGGSGTTLIACENTRRVCYMMEREPKYVQVILDRYAMYTGNDPVRSDGKPWSVIKSS